MKKLKKAVRKKTLFLLLSTAGCSIAGTPGSETRNSMSQNDQTAFQKFQYSLSSTTQPTENAAVVAEKNERTGKPLGFHKVDDLAAQCGANAAIAKMDLKGQVTPELTNQFFASLTEKERVELVGKYLSRIKSISVPIEQNVIFCISDKVYGWITDHGFEYELSDSDHAAGTYQLRYKRNDVLPDEFPATAKQIFTDLQHGQYTKHVSINIKDIAESGQASGQYVVDKVTNNSSNMKFLDQFFSTGCTFKGNVAVLMQGIQPSKTIDESGASLSSTPLFQKHKNARISRGSSPSLAFNVVDFSGAGISRSPYKPDMLASAAPEIFLGEEVLENGQENTASPKDEPQNEISETFKRNIAAALSKISEHGGEKNYREGERLSSDMKYEFEHPTLLNLDGVRSECAKKNFVNQVTFRMEGNYYIPKSLLDLNPMRDPSTPPSINTFTGITFICGDKNYTNYSTFFYEIPATESSAPQSAELPSDKWYAFSKDDSTVVTSKDNERSLLFFSSMYRRMVPKSYVTSKLDVFDLIRDTIASFFPDVLTNELALRGMVAIPHNSSMKPFLVQLPQDFQFDRKYDFKIQSPETSIDSKNAALYSGPSFSISIPPITGVYGNIKSTSPVNSATVAKN